MNPQYLVPKQFFTLRGRRVKITYMDIQITGHIGMTYTESRMPHWPEKFEFKIDDESELVLREKGIAAPELVYIQDITSIEVIAKAWNPGSRLL